MFLGPRHMVLNGGVRLCPQRIPGLTLFNSRNTFHTHYQRSIVRPPYRVNIKDSPIPTNSLFWSLHTTQLGYQPSYTGQDKPFFLHENCYYEVFLLLLHSSGYIIIPRKTNKLLLLVVVAVWWWCCRSKWPIKKIITEEFTSITRSCRHFTLSRLCLGSVISQPPLFPINQTLGRRSGSDLWIFTQTATLRVYSVRNPFTALGY